MVWSRANNIAQLYARDISPLINNGQQYPAMSGHLSQLWLFALCVCVCDSNSSSASDSLIVR